MEKDKKGSLIIPLLDRKSEIETILAKSIQEILKNPGQQLSVIKKEQGEQRIIDYLQIKILQINEFVSVARPMSAENITKTAGMILEDFWYLTVKDIEFIFSEAEKGHYGQLYETLNGQKIYSWFDIHFNSRCDICEEQTEAEKPKDTFKRTSEGKLLRDFWGDLKKKDYNNRQ
jgi:hypothetical protein